MKKNMYYIIMGVCVLAIGAMITVALVAQQGANPGNDGGGTDVPGVIPDDGNGGGTDEPVVNPDPVPVVFGLPVAGGKVINDYSMHTIVYWSTLNRYAVHNGIDFGGAEGAEVVAAYGGTVKSVTNDPLYGNVVTIDHGDGLVTSYGSIGEPCVSEGQTVEKGAKIGIISTSASNEMLDGAHVHFSVYKDGKIISPYDFLPSGDK